VKNIYVFMVLSTIFYAINGTIDFIVIKHLQFGVAVLSIAVGMLIGAVALAAGFKLRLHLKKRRYYAFSAVSALMIVLYSIILFFAYTRYDLAGIYSLIGLSALVFLFIDIVRYHKKVPTKQTFGLLLGVVLIVLGIFYAESNGQQFQVGTIPFILGIGVISGIGYYMEFYKIKKYSIGTKLIFQPVFLIPIALLLAPSISNANFGYIALGIVGGLLFSLASVLELRAMKTSSTKSIKATVIRRNYINDFEYADTMLVLAGSVLIGSYYAIQLLGGVLIVAGILVIGHVK